MKSHFFGFCIFLSTTLMCSCNKRDYNDEVCRFHNDGRAKPTISLIPVLNRSDANVGWNLSEEFTDHLKHYFATRDHFYFKTPHLINKAVAQLNEKHNPFSQDIAWIKEIFTGQEFIIFTEIIEHDIHPKPSNDNFIDKLTPSYELSMAMRIRVFDMRGEQPEIILQEILRQDHLIPKPKDPIDYPPDPWKKFSFTFTPIGFAHLQFAKETAKRIEEYITLSIPKQRKLGNKSNGKL